MHRSIYCGLCVVLILTFRLACCVRPLHLLSILPYPIQNASQEEEQPSYTEGPALFIASELAVDLINNKTDLLPDYELKLIKSDGGCNLLYKVEQVLFEDILYNSKNVQAVVGPGCSHSTLVLGNIIARPNVDLLSISLAGTMELFDRTRYRNSFSSLDSSTVYVETLETIIKNEKWRSVTVIHDLSRPFFVSLAEQLMRLDISNPSFQLHFHGLLPPGDLSRTPVAIIPTMCPPESKIIVLLAGQELIRNILCLFMRNFSGLEYPTYQYIIVNHTPDSLIQNTSFEYANDTITCSSDEIEEFLTISIFIQYRLDTLERDQPSAGLNYSQFVKEYRQRVDEYNESDVGEEIEPSVFATAYFDATWALALALNNSREELSERTGLDLADYKYGHSNATEIIRSHLLQLNFNGMSGIIKFNESTGFVKHLIDIHQHRQRIAYYNSSSRQIINYGTQSVRYEEDFFTFVPISRPEVGTLLIVLILLLTAGVAGFHILHVVNINHPSIKPTHPKLYVFAFCGVYLEAVGTVLFIIGDALGVPVEHQCKLRYVGDMFRNTGRVLFFSSLSVIAFRVYRIFVHYMKPGKLISDFYLTSFVAIVTFVYFVVHCILTIILLPDPDEMCVQVMTNTVSGWVNCLIPREVMPWVVIIDAVPPLLLSSLSAIFSTLVACRGRVKIDQFKNNPILIVSYLYLLNSALWIAYHIIESVMENPDRDTQLISNLGSSTINISFGIIFLFFPPTLPIMREYYNIRLKHRVSPLWQRTKERLSLCGCMCANEGDVSPDNKQPATVDSTATVDTQDTLVDIQTETQLNMSTTANSSPEQPQTVYSTANFDDKTSELDTTKVGSTLTIDTQVIQDTVNDTTRAPDVVLCTEELSYDSGHHVKHIQVIVDILSDSDC